MRCPALRNNPPSGAVNLGTHQNSCTWLLGRGRGWSRRRRDCAHSLSLLLCNKCEILECGFWKLGSVCCVSRSDR